MKKADHILSAYLIVPLSEDYLTAILEFTDREIGKHYYTEENFLLHLERSKKDNLNASFLAIDKETQQIVALRLSYAPGTWHTEKADHLTPERWHRPIPHKQLGYFKSLFVDRHHQGKGLGPYLSQQSLIILKQQGALAVLSHSSLGSPQNSSKKYLTSLGFHPVKEHQHFWSHIFYHCAHCFQTPCSCTALEMILFLDDRTR